MRLKKTPESGQPIDAGTAINAGSPDCNRDASFVRILPQRFNTTSSPSRISPVAPELNSVSKPSIGTSRSALVTGF
jgi:hypothetical protein